MSREGGLSTRPTTRNYYGVRFLRVHDGCGANLVYLDYWADENELRHHPEAERVRAPAALGNVGLALGPANEGHVRAGPNGERLAYAQWEKHGTKPGRRKRHRWRRIADPVRAKRPRRNIGKEKGTEQTHLSHVVGWIAR